MTFSIRLALVLAAFVAAIFVVLTFEHPPIDTKQLGFRGVAMEQVKLPRAVAVAAAANQVPAAQPAVPPGSPPATSVYKNVQVLNDLGVAEFTRLMVAITSWVAPPEKGCNYCHAEGKDLSDDSLYTKVVARRMLQMTRHINSGWKNHVADTGVTCYTCHRGQPVPANVWFADPGPKTVMGMAGNRAGQNTAASSVALASLPYDPFTPYLAGKDPIRVLGKQALPPDAPGATIQATEGTYGLMMHISQALGENCTFCHNSRSFASWEGPPQRVTAYHGIRMVRDLNVNYLAGLKYPENRLGPLGDAAKANCATCHQGVSKPLLGVSMLKDYPELAAAGKPAVAAVPVPEPVVVGEMVIVYFGVDSTALHGAAPATLGVLVAKLKANPKAKATISGYHSATGDAAHNHELARGRAFAVRDALKTAGISEDRVILEKPIVEQANVAGEDPKARRVEVTVK